MKKVSFVFSPYLPSTTTHPYLSIELLFSILKQSGFETEKFDFNLKMNRLVYDENLYQEAIKIRKR